MKNTPGVECLDIGEVSFLDTFGYENELLIKDLIHDVIADPVLVGEGKDRWVDRLYLGKAFLIELLDHMPQCRGLLAFAVHAAISFGGDHDCLELD